MGNHRVKWKWVLVLGVLLTLLMAGCDVLETPMPTLPPPTATLMPTVPPPTAPAGWAAHNQDTFQIALPDTWQEIKLDDATLKSEIDTASNDNPHLADTLRGLLTSGQNKDFLFYAADAKSTGAVVDNVSIARTTPPGGTPVAQAVQDVANALPQLLKGAKVVSTNGPLTINGQAAAELDYDLPLVNSDGQLETLRGVQYLFVPSGGDAYVVTVTGDASQADQWMPLARQIEQSFWTKGQSRATGPLLLQPPG